MMPVSYTHLDVYKRQVYDTTIRNAGGKVVALFRGKSYRIAGEVIAGLEAEERDPDSAGTAANEFEGNPQ